MVESVNEASKNSEFDLAIIGGGIIGICTAWYAAQQFPEWRIAVFEQNKIGSGASYYSASLDLPYGHTPLRHQLASRSGKLYSALRQSLLLPIKDLLFYGIAGEENAEVILSNFVDGMSQISEKKRQEALTRFPELLVPVGKAIIAYGSASYAIENKIAKCLSEYFKGQHSIFEDTAIESVTLGNQQYNLQTSTGEHFITKKIVQATGPWLGNLLKDRIQPLQNIRVKKIVAFHIMQQPKPDSALLYFFDDDAFLLPKYEAGYWLFSFKCDHWDVLPDVNNLNIDDADRIKAQSILKKYYPSFEALCNDGRVFCDAYTKSGDP